MIRPVSYREILDDPNWPALLKEYSEECSLPELGAATPQPELYERLERSGGFQAFGVYSESTLVGFSTVMVYVLPHYGKRIAATESIFIARKHRKLGLSLMRNIEVFAQVLGCEAFLYSAPVGSRFDKLLSVVNRHTSNVYLRKL